MKVLSLPLTLGQLRKYLSEFGPEDDAAIVRVQTDDGLVNAHEMWFDNDTASLNFSLCACREMAGPDKEWACEWGDTRPDMEDALPCLCPCHQSKDSNAG